MTNTLFVRVPTQTSRKAKGRRIPSCNPILHFSQHPPDRTGSVVEVFNDIDGLNRLY